MLPYTPLHHLLLAAVTRPIVLTSGNVSDEPIVYRDDEARATLKGIADAFLTHDRAIHVRTDDSVARSFRGRPMLLRRSRGYVARAPRRRHRVPAPRAGLRGRAEEHVLPGPGAPRLRLAPHRGPGERRDAALVHRGHRALPPAVRHRPARSWRTTCTRSTCPPSTRSSWTCPPKASSTTTRTSPPAWPTTARQARSSGWPSTGPATAPTARSGAVSSWPPAWLPSSAAATSPRCPCRAARPPSGSRGGWPPPTSADPEVARRHQDQWPAVIAMAAKGINSPLTSSAGRLFDAAAAILGVRDAINYEGQAAVELEQLADPGETGAYPAAVEAGVPFTIRGSDLLHAVIEDRTDGVPAPVIAARFHHGVAALIEAGCLLHARAPRPGHGRAVRRRVPEPAAAAAPPWPGWRPAASASCCTPASRATTAASALAKPWSWRAE